MAVILRQHDYAVIPRSNRQQIVNRYYATARLRMSIILYAYSLFITMILNSKSLERQWRLTTGVTKVSSRHHGGGPAVCK